METSKTSLAARLPDEGLRHAQERLRFHKRYLPDTEVLTHTGKPARFYTDLVRDRKVVIGVMYTSCQNYCTPVTRNLLEAQQHLGELARSTEFILLSLTPLEDRPADLRRYMERHGLGAGWTLVTGSPTAVEEVAVSLGLMSRDPADRDLRAHASSVKIGDEARVRWGHAAALARPRSIARMIRFELA